MQLIQSQVASAASSKQKKARNLTLAIAQASAILLGVTHANAAPLDGAAFPESTSEVDNSVTAIQTVTEEQPWKVDTAVLMYQESDGRVQATEPVIAFSKDYGNEHVFSGKLVLDTLTGASPNGAARANVAQTFTGPSGSGATTTKAKTSTITSASGRQTTRAVASSNQEEESASPQVTQAGALPVDTSFKDTRYAASANWAQPISERNKINVGANVSSEYDFKSLGANIALSRDFNDKNTTLSGGLSLEADSINAVGGAPVPFSALSDANKDGDKSKLVIDGLLGITQVLNRHALLQLNYSVSSTNGYMTDPYKFLSVVDTKGNLIDDPNSTAANQYVYLFENRPDTRLRHSVFAELKYIFNTDVIDVSGRFTTDDWGVTSKTVDAKYRFEFADNLYLEPHVRFYNQTKADFYHPYLQSGVDFGLVSGVYKMNIPYASADSRLGAFDATTFGAKLGMKLAPDSEISLRVEQYNQTAKQPTGFSTGNLAGQQLQPDMSALLAQVSYSFTW